VFVPRMLPLSDAAKARFEAFRQLRSATLDGMVGREREWWSKGDAKVLRLAGTLAMLEWAWQGGDEPAEISLERLDAAVTLLQDYFWPHSRAAIRHIGATRHHAHERRVLLWLRKTQREMLAVEDVRRNLFAETIDAADTVALLERLTAAGWLRQRIFKPPSGAGRPARRWMVNPALHAAAEGG
jgi:hypothetical protein